MNAVGFCAALLLIFGCATTTPYIGQGPHPQIVRGAPNAFLDGLGNVLGLPSKLLLWSWKIDNHAVSAKTEQALVDFLGSPQARALPPGTKFRLNQYAPLDDLHRLTTNRRMAWPFRLLLGVPTTLVFEGLLPGRLLGGDHYNPFTNTVHIYSDDAAVMLHEAGHADDFAKQSTPGIYATLRLLPPVVWYQEYVATDTAVNYLIAQQDRVAELHAYKILYPAYGTYVGGYLISSYGSAAGALVGHAWGRWKAASRARYYRQMDDTTTSRTRPRADAIQTTIDQLTLPAPPGPTSPTPPPETSAAESAPSAGSSSTETSAATPR